MQVSTKNVYNNMLSTWVKYGRPIAQMLMLATHLAVNRHNNIILFKMLFETLLPWISLSHQASKAPFFPKLSYPLSYKLCMTLAETKTQNDQAAEVFLPIISGDQSDRKSTIFIQSAE